MSSISLFIFLFTLILCYQTVFSNTNPMKSHFPKSSSSKTPLFDESVKFCLREAQSTLIFASFSLKKVRSRNIHLISGTMVDCIELLDDSVDQLSNIIDHLKFYNFIIQNSNDIQTWLSSALTNQQTCIESLKENYHKMKLETKLMESMVKNLSDSLTNSLAIYVSIKARGNGRRKLLSHNNINNDKFPKWVSKFEGNLLKASIEEIEISGVVDKHGNGTHKTIGEAIGSLAGEGRKVIHIKAGTYHENLKFSTKQKNIMLVGDGKGKTVIVGDRNADEGWTTFQSATVGEHFLFINFSLFISYCYIYFVNNLLPSTEMFNDLRAFYEG